MSIFIFHRDLRIEDNTTLNKLCELSDDITLLFIFNPEQIDSKNSYRSINSIRFMIESLKDLQTKTSKSINFLYGKTQEVVEYIFKNNQISNIGFNFDYTPYAMRRTKKILELCKKYDVNPVIDEDYTLLKMSEFRDGKYYSVFKPFYNRVINKKVPKPKTTGNIKKYFSKGSSKIKFGKYKTTLEKITKKVGITPNKLVPQVGGRNNGLKVLGNLKNLKNYNKNRNIPSIPTSLMSAHIKFGTISIREAYYKMKQVLPRSELIRQLIWHDFYAHLVYYLPEKNTLGGGNFKNKNIRWSKNSKWLEAWKKGTTGFPIVDAGMRQLNASGWMHNRIRLIVSNFLSLILLQNWKDGEKYFAQKLVDYDPCSNCMNWQFSAQVGTDRVPYLRIYNPFSQSKEVDKNCIYIKKWIPELKNVDNDLIHKWDREYDSEDVSYPKPIVDLKERMVMAKKVFKK